MFFDSFRCALGYVRLTQVRRWVPPGSLGSHGFTLGFVWFIRGSLENLRSPWVTLGSSGVVGLTRVRSGGR